MLVYRCHNHGSTRGLTLHRSIHNCHQRVFKIKASQQVFLIPACIKKLTDSYHTLCSPKSQEAVLTSRKNRHADVLIHNISSTMITYTTLKCKVTTECQSLAHLHTCDLLCQWCLFICRHFNIYMQAAHNATPSVNVTARHTKAVIGTLIRTQVSRQFCLGGGAQGCAGAGK